MNSLTLVAIIVLTATKVVVAQIGSNTSQKIIAEFGKDVVIPCNYNKSKGETIFSLSWKQGQKDIVTAGADMSNFQNDFKERASLNLETKDLTLMEVSFDDATDYTCTVISSNGTNTEEIYVDVLTSPQVTTRVVSVVLPPRVSDGSEYEKTMVAECSAVGGSKPFTMKWVTGSQKDMVTNDSFRTTTNNLIHDHLEDAILPLMIHPDPERNHRRQFTCVVVDALGKEISSDVVLDVTVQTTTPPTTTMQALPMVLSFPDKTTMMKTGEKREFECNATGVPSPRVVWYKGHEKLSKGVGSAKFTITSATFDDTSVYTCKAFNREGSNEKQFQLNVKGVPVIFKSETPENASTEEIFLSKEDTDFTITCEARAVPKPSFRWSVEGANFSDVVIDEAIDVADDVIKSEVKLSPVYFSHDVTKIECIAFNSEGQSSRGFKLFSAADEKKQPPLNVALIAGMIVAAVFFLSLIFLAVFFIVTSSQRKQADVSSPAAAEGGCNACTPACFTSNPCSKKGVVPDENPEEDEGDQVKEVGEEGTSEEKQKLTEAEEHLAEKDKASTDSEGKEITEETEITEKKKRKIHFSLPSPCCQNNKKELKEEDSVEGEAKEEVNGQAAKEGKEGKDNDADSGKGDTLGKDLEENKI